MTSGLTFLIAARRCEINELQQLALTSALVNVTGRLVHALQRERGLSNLHLVSGDPRFATQWRQQCIEADAIVHELRACLQELDTEPARVAGSGTRLFSRIAYAWQGLDGLPALRAQVQARSWPARQATQGYVKLIAGLLGVVFEAADNAADPQVTRLLVALFNFMQAKEFAGQERAAGSALFAAGRADASGQQWLLHLIESQERCLQVFGDFVGDGGGPAAAAPADLERLRRILGSAAEGSALDTGLSQAWFDCCSSHIDRMKAVEDALARELQQVCERRIEAATVDLQACEALERTAAVSGDGLSFFRDPAPGPAALAATGAAVLPRPGYGPQLERSILELVHEQAQRLQAIGEELDSVRTSLNERKTIERAKGLLMAHQSLSEEDAHKALRQLAMNQKRRLIEVAESVLALAAVLPARDP